MFNQKFLSNLLLLFVFQAGWGIMSAEAGLLGDYTTNSDPIVVKQRRTLGSGSRLGCRSNLPEKSVELLVPPSEVVHQTNSPTPTLFLHSKVASSLPFKFTLVNPQVDQPLVEQTFSISEPGIKQIKLPKSTKLEEGTVYLWYVAIPCGRDPQQYQEVLGAAIERVPVTRKVKTQLQLANTTDEKATVYARNGIWYEAVDLAVGDYTNPTTEGNSSDYLEQLLSSVNSKQ